MKSIQEILKNYVIMQMHKAHISTNHAFQEHLNNLYQIKLIFNFVRRKLQ